MLCIFISTLVLGLGTRQFVLSEKLDLNEASEISDQSQTSSSFEDKGTNDNSFKKNSVFNAEPLLLYKDNIFRIQKLNLLWNKARQSVPKDQLELLYTDLELQDKYEMELKRVRENGLDKEGVIEEKVLKNFRYIMEFYLPDYVSSDKDESNEIPEDDNWNDFAKEVYFQDPKLQSMWIRAQQSGFSEEDLSMLKEEFEHQQMKIHEYHFVHNEIYSHAGSYNDEHELENSKRKLKLTPGEAVDKMELLKQHKINMKEGYMNLEYKVSNLPNSEPSFTDFRVKKLWDLAKKTNWSSEELSSFQEELQHFEAKADKHLYYLTKLKSAKDELESGVGQEAEEKLDFLSSKATRMEKKMRQIHDDLQSKILQSLPHTEL